MKIVQFGIGLYLISILASGSVLEPHAKEILRITVRVLNEIVTAIQKIL
jgi:hypothetical protein